MIEPPPALIISGTAYLPASAAALTVTANAASQSASSMSTTDAFLPDQALFIRMSIRPYVAAAKPMSPRRSAARVTSAAKKLAVPPAARMPRTTSSPACARRPLTTTFAPSSANSSAVARPMPAVDPVTTAAFPFNLSMSGSSAPRSQGALGRCAFVCDPRLLGRELARSRRSGCR